MTNPTRDGWTACPPGAVYRAVDQPRSSPHARRWLTAVGWTAALVLTAAGCWQATTVINGWKNSTGTGRGTVSRHHVRR